MLEQEIVPEFYNRDASGIPVAWTQRVRESMARLTPRFSANRAVREYTELHYLPGAEAFLERSKNRGEMGAGVLAWEREIEEHWQKLRFGSLSVATDAGSHNFTVHAWLDELNPDAVVVELFANPDSSSTDETPVRVPMTRGPALVGSEGGYAWTAKIPADRPAQDFTPRLVPHHPAAQVPLESQRILWYR